MFFFIERECFRILEKKKRGRPKKVEIEKVVEKKDTAKEKKIVKDIVEKKEKKAKQGKKKKERKSIEMDIKLFEQLKKEDKEKGDKKAKAFSARQLIAEHGISGVERNPIDEKFQSEEFILELESILKTAKRYKNIDVYPFVPVKEAKKIKAGTELVSYMRTREEDMDKLHTKKGYIAIPSDCHYCPKCGGYKDAYCFFGSTDKTQMVSVICRDCAKIMCEELYEKYQNLEQTLLLMCLYTNCMYHSELAQGAIKNLLIKEEHPRMLFTFYKADLHYKMKEKFGNRGPQTFEYSNFEGNIFKFVKQNDGTPVAYFEEQNKSEDISFEIEKKGKKLNAEKWGMGYTALEYNKMNSLYDELMKFKSSKKNIIQTNALVEYVKLKTRLDSAMGKGDLRDIEKWQKLADSAAKNAGIKLDQLTAEDFGEGVDSWTNLIELTEEYNSVIPLMPKVKEMPYDDIDFIIWEVVNYSRRLMDMPEVDYESVWKHVDARFTSIMKDRGFTTRQITEEKKKRNAIFKDLGDNYSEPLWLNPNLEVVDDEED